MHLLELTKSELEIMPLFFLFLLFLLLFLSLFLFFNM